tara:strand:+ start:1643 stop:1777 length:135 start_codon:yes stop_codon:yes gene_type:complete
VGFVEWFYVKLRALDVIIGSTIVVSDFKEYFLDRKKRKIDYLKG